MGDNFILLFLAFLWGTFLGLFYFGGLWLTLKTMLGKRRPGRRLVISAVARLALVLSGFWIILRRDPAIFFFTLAGFFLARIVLTRMLGHESKGPFHATNP